MHGAPHCRESEGPSVVVQAIGSPPPRPGAAELLLRLLGCHALAVVGVCRPAPLLLMRSTDASET